MTDDFELYDSRVEIACAEFPNKYIGVLVWNRGTNPDGELIVSITRYGPCLGDIASGGNVRQDKMHEEIVKGTVYALGRIDEAIAELEEHRERLNKELERLRSMDHE